VRAVVVLAEHSMGNVAVADDLYRAIVVAKLLGSDDI
jgi:hypothetical protein